MRRYTPTYTALALCLVLPAGAQAKAKTLDGHVIAPPSVSKKRVSVPVLLTSRAERRLRLGKAVVRVIISRRALLAAPAPTGRGKVKIRAATLRAGDRLKAAVKISRKQRKRLRKRAVPAMKVKRPRVPARASALSTDELMRIVESLAAQLSGLSRRVDDLAAFTSYRFDYMFTRLQATEARLAALEVAFGQLQGSFADLLARINLLESILPDPAQIATLVTNVQSLLERVTAQETLTATLGTTVATLTGTVSTLQGQITTLQGQVTPLLTEVTSLGTRVTTVETTLSQLPGLITQVTGLDSALQALEGRVGAAETGITTLDGAVAGLQSSVGTLDATVGGLVTDVAQQASDIGGLQSDVSGLQTNVALLQSGLGTLQGSVTTLEGTVGGLQGSVSTLQGTVSSICGMVIIDVC